ncbi:MAG TPA: hypothetical protein VH479_15535 [Acidimicrobiales bacterium]|jgi:ABC-type glycerol-3-phosphate transport system substrate-binding protein
MTKKLRTASALAAAGALLLAVSGCSVGGGGGPSAASPPSTQTTTTVRTATVPVTPPGTLLNFGQPANVQINNGANSGVVAVAVIAITPGTREQAAQLNIGNGEAYYATMQITNTAAPVDLGDYVPDVIGYQSDGIQAANVIEPNDFTPCPDNGPVSLPLGSSFLTCEAFVAVEGVPVTSVGFSPGFDFDPIIWKQPA